MCEFSMYYIKGKSVTGVTDSNRCSVTNSNTVAHWVMTSIYRAK